MRHARIPILLLFLLLLCSIPSQAAENTPAPDAASLAEDVALLNALNPLRLTREQIRSLLPHLQGARTRLLETEAAGSRSFDGLQTLLTDARGRLIVEKGTAAAVEEQVTLNRQSAAGRMAQLRRDLATGLQRTLRTTLTTAQQERIALRGRQLTTERQLAQRGPIGARLGGRGAAEAGGPQDQMLDRIRQMPQQEFEQFMQRMARRPDRPGAPDMEGRMSFFNRVRGLTPDAFQRTRRQLGQEMLQFRGAPAGELSQDADLAFIDRYFMSPRTVPLLEELSRTGE